MTPALTLAEALAEAERAQRELERGAHAAAAGSRTS